MIKLSVKTDNLIKMVERTTDLKKNMAALNFLIVGRPGTRDPMTIRGGFVHSFASKGASIGTSWPALNAKYARWKQKEFPGKPMLVRSGRLVNSLIGKTNDTVDPNNTGNKIVFGTTVPYAGIHQLGGPKIPTRKFLQITKTQQSFWRKLIKVYYTELANGEAK